MSRPCRDHVQVAEFQMSVRKRAWIHNGTSTEAWVVDFVDSNGKRRLKTFKTKNEADRFHDLVAAVRSGLVPDPLTAGWFHPIAFETPLPDGGFRRGKSRNRGGEVG